MFRIFDTEYRRVIDDFDTREEAEQRLAELLEAEPAAELQVLAVGKSGFRPRALPSDPRRSPVAEIALRATETHQRHMTLPPPPTPDPEPPDPRPEPEIPAPDMLFEPRDAA